MHWKKRLTAGLLAGLLLFPAGCGGKTSPGESGIPSMGAEKATGSASVDTATTGSGTTGAASAGSGATTSAGASTGTATTSAPRPTGTTSAASTATVATTTEKTTPTTTAPPAEGTIMKACWLSQFDMADVYRSGGKQRAKADFTARVRTVFRNLKGMGLNAVIIQVRPYGDSFYPSDYYPWSDYISGAFGVQPAYDPFAVMVEEAKAQGLEVHAWLNPLRAMKVSQITAVSSSYALRRWYDDPAKRGTYIVEQSNGRWYLNPAYEEVRRLIADGAAEVASRYAVDGVHIDDYFYPTTDAAYDEAAYRDYRAGGGKLSLADFRRDNISRLVKGMYQAVKKANGRARFGVSPDANIERNLSTHYADVKTWCAQTGYVDYICPQIYFGMQHQTMPFDRVARDWNALVKTESVRLVVGMTLEKAVTGEDKYAGTGNQEWKRNKNVLRRCMESLPGLSRFGGVALFSYQFLYHPVTGAEIAALREEKNNFLPVLQGL